MEELHKLRERAEEIAGRLQVFASGSARRGESIASLLSEPTRRKIVALLYLKPGLTSSQIARILGYTPATISKHMALLREAGIVRIVESGSRVEKPFELSIPVLSGDLRGELRARLKPLVEDFAERGFEEFKRVAEWVSERLGVDRDLACYIAFMELAGSLWEELGRRGLISTRLGGESWLSYIVVE